MRISDWSSDVCSSDLPAYGFIYPEASSGAGNLTIASADLSKPAIRQLADNAGSGQRQKFKREEMDGNGRRNLAAIIDQVKKRSEERSVGKGWVSTCRSRWSR